LPRDPEHVKAFLRSLTPEQREEGNRIEREEAERQHARFRDAYVEGKCYLCGDPFDQMRSSTPCSHWLLRRCRFKKQDFPRIFSEYDYINIAAFLRWCANQEVFLRNINDLKEERSDRKVISCTIKWKNIEWTFDCTTNDLRGHGTGHSAVPHYHFQMRIDGRRFIDFNDFHIPFSDRDLFHLSVRDEPWIHQGFGAGGAGMEEATSVDPEKVLEFLEPCSSEDEAAYRMSTIVEATDKPLSGDELHEIFQEAKRTNKSVAYLLQQRLRGRARVQTVISPSEAVPAIAARKENKPR